MDLSNIDLANPVNYRSPLSRGLVGFWVGLPTAGEYGGRILKDLTRFKRHGKLTNGPTWVESPYGNEVNFDGSDDFVDVGNWSYNLTNITVIADITPAVLTRGDIVAHWISGSPNRYQYNLLQGLSSAKLQFFISRGGVAAEGSGNSTSSLVVGSRCIAGGTYDGATVGVWFNGALEASASFAGSLYGGMTVSDTIGKSFDASYTGRIRSVLIYNRALSASEMLGVTRDVWQGLPTLLNRPKRKFFPVGGVIVPETPTLILPARFNTLAKMNPRISSGGMSRRRLSNKIETGNIDLQNPINERSPLAKGLVGFWMGLPQAGEWGGGKLKDLTRFKRHGTLTNGPTWVGGPYGNAVNYAAASSQYTDIAASPRFDFSTNDFVIAAMLIPTSTTSQQIWLGKDVSGNRSWTCWVNLSGNGWITFNENSGATGSVNTGAAVFAANDRVVVVVSRVGGTIKIFTGTNGGGIAERGSAAITANFNQTGKPQIARREFSGAFQYFDGQIGPMLIWNGAGVSAAGAALIGKEIYQGFPTLLNRRQSIFPVGVDLEQPKTTVNYSVRKQVDVRPKTGGSIKRRNVVSKDLRIVDLQNPINYSSPLAKGLIGFWMGLPQAGEYGGGKLKDLTRFKRHGTLTNGPTWVGSPYGPGITYNGSTQKTTLGTVSQLNGVAYLFAEIAVSNVSTANTGTGRRWFGKWGPLVGNQSWLIAQKDGVGTTLLFAVHSGGSVYTIGESTGAVTASSTDHFAVLFNGTATVKIWKNGVALSVTNTLSGAATAQTSTDNASIGADVSGTNGISGTVLMASVRMVLPTGNELAQRCYAEWRQGFPTLLNRRQSSFDFSNTENPNQTYWNVLETLNQNVISNNIQLLWNLRSQLANSPNCSWDVLTSLNQNANVLYNVGQLLSQNNEFSFNVRELINKRDHTLWNTLAQMSQNNQILYNILGTLSQNNQTLWDLRGQVDLNNQVLWDVNSNLNYVLNNQIVLWNTLSQLAGVAQENWDVRGTTGQSNQITWNDLISISPSTFNSINWNVLQTQGLVNQITYNVAAQIINNPNVSWNTLLTTSTSNNIQYNIRTLVLNSVMELFQVRSLTEQQQEIIWNTLSDLIQPNNVLDFISYIQRTQSSVSNIEQLSDKVSYIKNLLSKNSIR